MSQDKTETFSFAYRLKMCRSVHEGSELEDIIQQLCYAANGLHAFEDHLSEIVLLIAEKLCTEFVKQEYLYRQAEWEEYDQLDPVVYAHFTGGAQKLSQEEYERRG